MQEFQTDNIDEYKKKALHWASFFSTACYFDSNSYADPYSTFDVLIAAGVEQELECRSGKAFEALESFIAGASGYKLGFLGYDLKNEIENLSSENSDPLQFPDLYFFVPLHLIIIKGSTVRIISEDAGGLNEAICSLKSQENDHQHHLQVSARLSREEYLKTVNRIKDHILKGDVYEVTYCQEFYTENAKIDPVALFTELNATSPTPFANFFKRNNKYIISATPERYLSRRGDKLISQPIKGTAPRNTNTEIDQQNKDRLFGDEKERAENVMIVDLVRNDLTRCAKLGTVQVEELFGIYSFKQVHQMISTVVCEADETLSNAEIIKRTFPMGSMTGAPKVRAMELIEAYERSKRGVFSGAVGYFSPEGDFDFNVIIRSILYDATHRYLSFQVGSAITFEAEAAREYEECLLKASAIQKILQ